MLPDADARRILRSHRGSPVTRLHVLSRVLTCPVDPVLDALANRKSILDVGCGHGLFALLAALRSPGVQVVGTDVDEDKITLARKAARSLGVDGRVDFTVAVDGAVPAGPFDAVLCVDVLYLLGPDRGAALLRSMAAALGPCGVLVVKEMNDAPRWKVRWNHVQEVGATRVFRYTEGDDVDVMDPASIVSTMESAGLDVTRRSLDRHYPHPHLLVVGTKPDADHDLSA